MSNNTQNNYAQRLHAVFQYMDTHIGQPIPLVTLAEIACFSPYHFHRIFTSITGEGVYQYLQRRRMEQAAAQLLHNDQKIIKELAHELGFESPATFNRAFKKHFGTSPSAFRKAAPNRNSKVQTQLSKNGQVSPSFEPYIRNGIELKNWIDMHNDITIKTIAPITMAYVNCIGSQGIPAAFETILAWAMPHKLLDNPKNKVMTVYHDSFKFTPADKVRMSAGLGYTEKITPEPPIGQQTLSPGKCIQAHFEITIHEFEKAWSGLFIWMHENGYQKAKDRPPFEIYHNDFRKHPEQRCIVDFCIPIQ